MPRDPQGGACGSRGVRSDTWDVGNPMRKSNGVATGRRTVGGSRSPRPLPDGLGSRRMPSPPCGLASTHLANLVQVATIDDVPPVVPQSRPATSW